VGERQIWVDGLGKDEGKNSYDFPPRKGGKRSLAKKTGSAKVRARKRKKTVFVCRWKRGPPELKKRTNARKEMGKGKKGFNHRAPGQGRGREREKIATKKIRKTSRPRPLSRRTNRGDLIEEKKEGE